MTRRRDPDGPAISLETARQVLAAQPFSGLLGARLATFEPGEAVLDVPVRSELTQQNGFLHGGVLAYAADNAITFAGGSVLGSRVLTGGITITYLRPAAGELLQARATVVDASRRQAICRCELVIRHGDRSVLCAAAQGTVVLVATGEDAA